MSDALASVEQLSTLLKITIQPNDAYATMILAQASNAVRDAARQPGWVWVPDGGTPGPGQTAAPSGARDIALWVASRAYTDPRNKSRKTAGPLSESYFENGLYGLDLSEDERRRLDKMAPTGGLGVWTLPLEGGEDIGPLTVPSDMDPPGDPFIIADSDHFPYAHPED